MSYIRPSHIRVDIVQMIDPSIELPDSKLHEANMGPTWILSAPDGPHVGPMNLAIGVSIRSMQRITNLTIMPVWFVVGIGDTHINIHMFLFVMFKVFQSFMGRIALVNMNIYLHVVLFLHTEMANVIELVLLGNQGPVYISNIYHVYEAADTKLHQWV